MKQDTPGRPSRSSRKIFGLIGTPESLRIISWGVFFTFVLVIVFFIRPTLLQRVDNINYDLLLRSFPNNQASSKIVIVDLDEETLKKYGQWPWPRYRVAELFDKIAGMKPAVVGLDIIFPEPDRTSAGRLLKDLGDTYKLKIAVDRLPGALSDNDRILSETLARGSFVLGNKFQFSKTEKASEKCVLHPVRVSFIHDTAEQEKSTGLPESTGVLCNLKIISESVDASGFVNFTPDYDGISRHMPLLIQHNGGIYPSLALATVLKFRKIDNIILKKDGKILQSIHYNGNTVPVDPRGQLLIKFRGPKGSYEYISAAAIMEGSVSSARIQERIVFIGTSAYGLKDLLITPFDTVYPGVEANATVADNLLTGDFIAVPNWSNGLIILLIAILGILLSLLIALGNAAYGFIIMLLFNIALWLTTQQIFFRSGLFIGIAFPIASVTCIYIFLTVIKYRLEEKKRLTGMRELLTTQDITIESMANLAEYRNRETGGHIKRTRMYVKLLAEHIKHHQRYKQFLSNEYIDMLYKSAPLHDIGKVGIPDHILLKPSELNEEELKIMKTHTTSGRDVIESSVRKLGKTSFLTTAEEMAYTHQEKWDGSGYPQGLKGDEIPISGRLMALADVYDALISKRIYKSPFSHAVAVDVIKEGRGTHFDPDMVDAFLEIQEQFRKIAYEFADSQEEREMLEKDATIKGSTQK
jgi:adenylate cyclase